MGRAPRLTAPIVAGGGTPRTIRPVPLSGLRSRLASRGGYRGWIERVEPALADHPRVHRFAQPPVIGQAGLPPAELAVCVDPAGGGDLQATHDSLRHQSVAAVEVVEGGLDHALCESRAPWLVLLDAGDRLHPRALERLGQAVDLAPKATVLTCDADHLDAGGRRSDPLCRPGPSPDALLAGVQMPEPIAVHRDAAVAARIAPGPAWALELLLALAGAATERLAHVPLILHHRGRSLKAAGEAEREVVQRALGTGVSVAMDVAGYRRVRRPPSAEPAVEAIVCFRDCPELLKRCAQSLLAHSTYERLTLRLVDNGSAEPATAELLTRLARDRRVRVTRDEAPFNFAALNNRAAAASQADVLVFLNNDTEVISPDWVEGLLEEAMRSEVGAVAPLLLYPDRGGVQHAGAALGLFGYAGHPFAGLDLSQFTPFGAAGDGTRNWLAVTAACLMVERRKFDAVGGFDETFVVAGNDVDLGLRLTVAGHRSLCVPHLRLLHHESASRDPHAIPAGDFARSAERYGEFRTVGDPFYNPNLTLTATDCGLRA